MQDHVINPQNFIYGSEYKQASSESDLGELSTHYYIGNSYDRMVLGEDDVQCVRDLMATKLERIYGSVYMAQADYSAKRVLIRPPLVFANKNTFDANSRYRARVVFDLDPPKNLTNPPQDINWNKLANVFCDATFQYFDREIDDDARWVLLGNRFEDKHASAHFYLCDYYWDQNSKCPAEFARNINSALREFGLEIDVSIATSGIKIPFCDKPTRGGGWRGNTIVPVAMSGAIETWDDFWAACDPCVTASDEMLMDPLNWKEAPRHQASQAQSKRRAVTLAEGAPVAANAATLEERLVAAVPQWSGADFRYLAKGTHQVVRPSSRFCPFKDADHDHVQTYVVLNLDGSFTLKCHGANCNEQSILYRPPAWERLSATERQYVSHYNARYARISLGTPAENYVISLDVDYEYPQTLTKFRSFHERQAWDNYTAYNPDTKKDVTRYKSKIWIDSGLATDFVNGYCFDPTTDEHQLTRFNQWRGYPPTVAAKFKEWSEAMSDMDAAEAKAFRKQIRRENIPAFCWHLHKVICSNDAELSNYVWRWICYMFQKPAENPEAVLVLNGPRGLGKTTFAQYISSVFGKWHHYTVEDPSQLFTRFNDFLMNVVFLTIEELAGADMQKHIGKFQALVTSTDMRVEMKNGPTMRVPNMLHTLIISNNEFIVPAGRDARRFQCIACGEGIAPGQLDRDYYDALHAERMSELAPAALYFCAMTEDLEDWHPREIVQTELLWLQKYNAMPSVHRWWYGVLKRGDIASVAGEVSELTMLELGPDQDVTDASCWSQAYPKRLFHASYCEEFEGISQHAFWSHLKKMFPNGFNASRPHAAGRRIRCVTTDSLEEHREAFQVLYKVDEGVWEY